MLEQEEWLYSDDDIEKVEVQHTEGQCNEQHIEGQTVEEEGQHNEKQDKPQQVSI